MILLTLLAVPVVLAAAILIFVNVAPQFGSKISVALQKRYAASPQWRDGFFHNLVETTMQPPDGSFAKTLREFFFGGVDRVPAKPVPIRKVPPEFFSAKNKNDVIVTWLGHSSLLIQFEDYTLLTDPMFGRRASPLPFMGPKRFNKNLPLSPRDVPHLDAIIISHDHYDHLDYSTIKALHQKTDAFYVPLGVAPHLLRWGVSPAKIREMDWWDVANFRDGIELIATPARHFSGRGFGDRFKTLWTSWVIKSNRHRIYFGADSGYGEHFQAIGDKYGQFDLTLLECGAYNKAWPHIHMMPEQTAQAHLDLSGKVLMPIHWAQFNLSLHPWREPIERLSAAAAKSNITLVTPEIGQSFVVGKEQPSARWWTSVPAGKQ